MKPDIALVILSALCTFFVVRKVIDFIAGVQQRRAMAGQLAPKVAADGLVEFSQFLVNYSIGGYVQIAEQLKKLFHTYLNNPNGILAEVDTVGKRWLDAKLSTAEGLAWVKAEIASVTAPASSSSGSSSS